MPIACIVVAYVVSLGRAVDYGFVWDDVPEIQNNAAFDLPLGEGLRLTQVERGAPELAELETLQFTYDSYRPITYASYWIDIAVWGRSARALHRTNVILGALAILLAYGVARRWLGADLAWLATGLFALHPAQIETVAYVSARGDLLAGGFALGATYAVLRAIDTASNRRAIAWTGLAVLTFVASLLAKETCLALPVALGGIAWARSGRALRWWAVAPLIIAAIVYVPFRAAMIEVREPAPLLDTLTGLPSLVVDSLRIILFPFDLSIERKVRTSAVLGAIGLAAGIVLVLWWWRRTRGSPAIWTGPCWFVLLLGPSSIVVARTGAVADRYLYLPLFGLVIGGTALVAALLETKRLQPAFKYALLGAGAIWSCIVLAVAWMQVPVWRDASSLYRHALAMEPTSSVAHYRVAVLEVQQGRWDVAVPLLERAIELDAFNVDALNNLGVYYLRESRAADAERTLLRAIVANPARFKAWSNLGLAQIANGEREAGCRSIARALVINPKYATARRARTQSCSP